MRYEYTILLILERKIYSLIINMKLLSLDSQRQGIKFSAPDVGKFSLYYSIACHRHEKKYILCLDYNPLMYVCRLKKFLPTELRACLISADDFQCRGSRRRYFGRLYERRALKSMETAVG